MIFIRISSLSVSMPPTSLNCRLGRSTSDVGAEPGSVQADRTRPSTPSLGSSPPPPPPPPPSSTPAVALVIRVVVRVDPEPVGELAVGHRGVGLDAAAVLPHGFLDLA